MLILIGRDGLHAQLDHVIAHASAILTTDAVGVVG